MIIKNRFTHCLVLGVFPAIAAPAVSADLLTFRWVGTTAANSIVQNQPVDVVFTIDTDTPMLASSTATRHEYEGAIVSGHYKVGEHLFPFVTSGDIVTEIYPDDIPFPDPTTPARNTILVRKDVESNGRVSNRLTIHASSDHVERGGIDPKHILINVFDYDVPRDTVVLDSGLDLPLDTVRTYSQGGSDTAVFGMGAQVGGLVSTVTSGEGSLSIVPEPGSLSLIAAGGLLIMRRRR